MEAQDRGACIQVKGRVLGRAPRSLISPPPVWWCWHWCWTTAGRWLGTWPDSSDVTHLERLSLFDVNPRSLISLPPVGAPKQSG